VRQINSDQEATMRNPIKELLGIQPLIFLDGATATELMLRGYDLNDPLWSAKVLIESPEMIREIHKEYFLAGADCAITTTYQATFEGFANRNIDAEKASRLMHLSVQLACEARDEFWKQHSHTEKRERPFVAASVGPYGAFLCDYSEYHGNYGVGLNELIEFHRSRFEVLANSGADMLACETIPCLLEAKALLTLLQKHPHISAWFSFSAQDESTISSGESIESCAQLLDDFPQVVAIGVNCTSPRYISELARKIKAVSRKPILCYPNSGETFDVAIHDWVGDGSCTNFGEMAKEWVRNGVQIIGGCCRTTPAHIRELNRLFRDRL
jgi:homocysteine S-methyltransferase